MFFAGHAPTKIKVEEGTSSAGGERLLHCEEHEFEKPHIAALLRRSGLRREEFLAEHFDVRCGLRKQVQDPKTSPALPGRHAGPASRPGTSSRRRLRRLASSPSPSCRRPANAARPNPSVNGDVHQLRTRAARHPGLSCASRPWRSAGGRALPQTLGVTNCQTKRNTTEHTPR